jgi:hypothetical protein
VLCVPSVRSVEQCGGGIFAMPVICTPKATQTPPLMATSSSPT